MRTRGVPGVHLVAGAENAGAVAFYPRVGFTALAAHPADENDRPFGMRLPPRHPTSADGPAAS
ncbi:hypothetical protein [Microbacterium elymi]|uniref:hypothetical protein n=1 Tax=Microbacterium elymi TaxID=2909587 RepID=UPI003F491705